MNPLLNILKELGDETVGHFAKYGGKISSSELRDSTVNALADRISSGVGHPSGISSRELLNHTPMLYRSEDISRTAARSAPEYNNVAVSTLDTAPLGFGGGMNNSHLTVLSPDLMNKPGQKALSIEDTGWMPPKAMDPVQAQDRMFIGDFGANKLNDRSELREAAWDIDNLDRMRSTGWMELNAPISRDDVAISAFKDHTFIDGQKGKLSSKPETMDAILHYLKSGSMDRKDVISRINKILPMVAAVPTAGVLGGLLSGQQVNERSTL